MMKFIIQKLVIIFLIGLFHIDMAYAAISQVPLFLTQDVPPIVMLTMGRDHKLYYEAYNDASDLVNWDDSKRVVFRNLKPTTRTISLRLPEYILDELKLLAHKQDVPYQSLIKIFLKDRIDQELRQG